MGRRMPIFYSALALTGVNLLLRMVSTSFQVYLSGQIGAAGIGLLQLVLSVGMMATTVGMAGVRTAAMYLTAGELGRKKPENVTWVLRGCFFYALCCGGAVSLGLFFAAPALASRWIGDPAALGALRLYASFLPVICLCGCLTGYFTAANRIASLAAVEVAEQLCSMAVTMTVLTIWARGDPGLSCQAVVLGSGAGSVLTFLALLTLRLREGRRPGAPIPVARPLLRTAVPLALADDLKSGISTAENLMVPKRLALYPGEASPLAAFGMVSGMVFPILMFPAAILFGLAELLLPELARCAAADSRRRIRYLVGRSLRAAMLYGSFFAGVLFLLAPELCQALYGSAQAGQYLRWFAPLGPMLYCDAITDAMTKGLGQQRACVRYNILTNSMDVALLFLLLPKYGMAGYFFSFLVTHLLNFILSLRLLLKISRCRIAFHIPAFTAAATALAVLAGTRVAPPALRLLAYLAVWSSCLVLFGVVSREDAAWLRGLVKGI